MSKKRAYIKTFGCQMNVHDSEKMAGILEAEGYEVTDERKGALLDWMSQQLLMIRRGEIELCHGATGADFPAIGWAEQSLTDFATAQIIVNYERRNQ